MSSRVRLLSLNVFLDSSMLCVLIVHVTIILVSLISYATSLIAEDHDDGTFQFIHLNASNLRNSKMKVVLVCLKANIVSLHKFSCLLSIM